MTYDSYALPCFCLQRCVLEAVSKGFQEDLVIGVLEWSPADVSSALEKKQNKGYL